jgi:hypothetical protein
MVLIHMTSLLTRSENGSPAETYRLGKPCGLSQQVKTECFLQSFLALTITEPQQCLGATRMRLGMTNVPFGIPHV